MIAALEKTVTLGADKRIIFDLSEMKNISEGEAQVVLLVLNNTEKRANAAPEEIDGSKTGSRAEWAKSPGTEAMLAEAEKTRAYNRAHPEEVRATLQRLQGSLPSSAFGGLDGVAYQRTVRAEWDDDVNDPAPVVPVDAAFPSIGELKRQAAEKTARRKAEGRKPFDGLCGVLEDSPALCGDPVEIAKAWRDEWKTAR